MNTVGFTKEWTLILSNKESGWFALSLSLHKPPSLAIIVRLRSHHFEAFSATVWPDSDIQKQQNNDLLFKIQDPEK